MKSQVHPAFLKVLSYLNLNRSAELALFNHDKLAAEADEDLQRELMEGSIYESSPKELQKLETELLTEIVVIYLRILRNKQLCAKNTLLA